MAAGFSGVDSAKWPGYIGVFFRSVQKSQHMHKPSSLHGVQIDLHIISESRYTKEFAIDYLFEDLLVVDAATFLAGPGAATVLSDFGATVIKIEPLDGDRYRTLKGNYETDYNWLLTSRNKKSLALDLSKKRGREIVHQLVEKADILVTNFIGQYLERYELEYERLKQINPRLIYAHVSGYGTEGSDVMRRAFDTTAWWARSGLMEFIRYQGAVPVPSAPGMGDHATSISLLSGIVMGLYRRERTGEGAHIETSLVANGVWSNGMALQGVIAGFDMSARRQATGFHNPFAHVYQTRDGQYVLFSIVNAAKEWPRLADALGHPEWIEDHRFSDMSTLIRNRQELIDLISHEVSQLTIDEALTRFVEHDLTHSHVQPMAQVVDDPQLAANEIIVDTTDDSPEFRKTVMNPIKIKGEQKKAPQRAPDVGANSIEVLQHFLDMDEEAIEGLAAEGVIGIGQ